MARTKSSAKYAEKIPMRPALTQEAQEDRCIALAYSLVEERLRNGTATSQETVHFLKLGTMRERTEREILEEKKKLIQAQTKQLQSAEKLEELYTNAIRAFTEYVGENTDEDEVDDVY